MTNRLYDIKEGQELLRIGKTTLYEKIRSGELKSVTVGRRRLLPETEINAFIERRLAEQTASAN